MWENMEPTCVYVHSKILAYLRQRSHGSLNRGRFVITWGFRSDSVGFRGKRRSKAGRGERLLLAM